MKGVNVDQPTVNRYLKDKAMDRIDHALGRPVKPFGQTYRNYFAIDTDSDLAEQFRKSDFWDEGKTAPGGMTFFSVNWFGREALSNHLKHIGDKNRHFTVFWGGMELSVVAETRSKARYRKWLDVSDTRDISFKEFQATASVRLAAY